MWFDETNTAYYVLYFHFHVSFNTHESHLLSVYLMLSVLDETRRLKVHPVSLLRLIKEQEHN